ncbi:MAG: hypothetical protein V4717_08580 [Bacteroidota bacterium]
MNDFLKLDVKDKASINALKAFLVANYRYNMHHEIVADYFKADQSHHELNFSQANLRAVTVVLRP